jgi:hypothetical protein
MGMAFVYLFFTVVNPAKTFHLADFCARPAGIPAFTSATDILFYANILPLCVFACFFVLLRRICGVKHGASNKIPCNAVSSRMLFMRQICHVCGKDIASCDWSIPR